MDTWPGDIFSPARLSLVLVDGIIHCRIGRHAGMWDIKAGQRLRFKQRARIENYVADEKSALLKIMIPRKGWNPDGPIRFDYPFSSGHILWIYRQDMDMQAVPPNEWEKIIRSVRQLRSIRKPGLTEHRPYPVPVDV